MPSLEAKHIGHNHAFILKSYRIAEDVADKIMVFLTAVSPKCPLNEISRHPGLRGESLPPHHTVTSLLCETAGAPRFARRENFNR